MKDIFIFFWRLLLNIGFYILYSIIAIVSLWFILPLLGKNIETDDPMAKKILLVIIIFILVITVLFKWFFYISLKRKKKEEETI